MERKADRAQGEIAEYKGGRNMGYSATPSLRPPTFSVSCACVCTCACVHVISGWAVWMKLPGVSYAANPQKDLQLYKNTPVMTLSGGLDWSGV